MRDVRMNALKWMVLAAAMLLSACANPFADDAPSFNDILSAGWLNDDEPSPVTHRSTAMSPSAQKTTMPNL